MNKLIKEMFEVLEINGKVDLTSTSIECILIKDDQFYIKYKPKEGLTGEFVYININHLEELGLKELFINEVKNTISQIIDESPLNKSENKYKFREKVDFMYKYFRNHMKSGRSYFKTFNNVPAIVIKDIMIPISKASTYDLDFMVSDNEKSGCILLRKLLIITQELF